ncbi:hypothetical protein TWF481_006515 [Arthrobotrys musiformis]|uniref:Uncharacterized protein n=1 Tax=Arthrobotrys musiformis TaxID=47236 RepID=A0AAV9WAL8_9PEZI
MSVVIASVWLAKLGARGTRRQKALSVSRGLYNTIGDGLNFHLAWGVCSRDLLSHLLLEIKRRELDMDRVDGKLQAKPAHTVPNGTNPDRAKEGTTSGPEIKADPKKHHDTPRGLGTLISPTSYPNVTKAGASTVVLSNKKE